jgi:hypothetical protein
VARTYFNRTNRTVGTLVPKSPPPAEEAPAEGASETTE